MMNVTELSMKASVIQHEIDEKANEAKLFYVICYWVSPLSSELSYRVGYFESITELEGFGSYLETVYQNYNFPYYITSNTSFKKDGGLFDDFGN